MMFLIVRKQDPNDKNITLYVLHNITERRILYFPGKVGKMKLLKTNDCVDQTSDMTLDYTMLCDVPHSSA